MSNNESQDRILNKIKKCMALASSSEPHEAAAALRQAQALMTKHNISEAAVSLPVINTASVRSAAVTKPKPYEVGLMNAIGKAFGCMLWFQRGSSYGYSADEVYAKYVYLGPSHQTAVAQYTASVLLRRLAKARATYNAELSVVDLTRRVDKRARTKKLDSFCYGWVVGVTRAVHALSNPPEVEEELKRRHARELGYTDQDEMEQDPDRNVKLKSMGHIDGLSAAYGKNVGSKESIHRPMESQPREEPKYLTH